MKTDDAFSEQERVRLKMLMLRSAYAYHKHMYYIQDEPELTDSQFDQLERDFERSIKHMKKTYPTMYKLYKPKLWVGAHHTAYGYPKQGRKRK